MSDIAMKQEPTPLEPPTPAVPDVEALLVKVWAVFAVDQNLNLRAPEAPTQAGFLALARAGKDVWNAWRKAYPEPTAIFISLDFHESNAIDFSGFSFAGGSVNQDRTLMTPCVDFSGCTFKSGANFKGTQFGKHAVLERVRFSSTANFTDARFEDNVTFQGSAFHGETNFELVHFGGVPNFHGCTLNQNTSFEGAKYSDIPSARAASAYRTLKLAFAQQHDIRKEQHFFRLEMRAETGITKYPKRLLYQLYQLLSDYGFSLIRPVGLWFICLVLATFSYGYLAEASFSVTNIDWPLTFRFIKYSLLNAVPLPGLDKMSADLFLKDSDIQLALTILEILHKTVSLVAFFLVGLALRNLFKMKG